MDNNYSSKVKDTLKNLLIPIISILIAIFVSVFFVVWSKEYSITQYFEALNDLFTSIFEGSFGSVSQLFQTLEYITPLIFTGVANAIAFKCGLFNIGVEGQFLMGMMSAAIIGIIPGIPRVIHIPLIIIGGILAGGLWAGIPGYLKAKFGINEVINSIMMNYIAINFANFLILRTPLRESGKDSTPMIQKSAQLLRLDNVSRSNTSVFIGIFIAILAFLLIYKSTLGYEIRAVGSNSTGAEYGGMSIKKNIILAMIISGAIAGIGGATHVSGILLKTQNFMGSINFGFDGIAVALLARSNPLACIISAVLFGTLNSSSKYLQLNGIPKEIVYLIQAIIIIFVASDYVFKYIANKRKKKVTINV